MADTSVAATLLVKPGTALGAPAPARVDLVCPLPGGATLAAGPAGAGIVLLFADNAASARAHLVWCHDATAAAAACWIAYAKVGRADINRDGLWPIAAEHGLRPNGQVAIGSTWSALRLRELRAGEAAFTGGRGD